MNVGKQRISNFRKSDLLHTAQSPISRLWYLSNYHDTLQAHKHPLHKLGNANTVVNYQKYYQTLFKISTAKGAASNAYLTASYVPVETKCIIMKYQASINPSKGLGLRLWDQPEALA